MARSTFARIASVIFALSIPFAARAGELEEDLIAATRDNDVAQVESLLVHGARANARDAAGNTALIISAAYGYTDMAALLITSGADVDIRGRLGHTALTAAAEEGNLEIARLLLDSGADVNVRTEYGHTAHSLAGARGHGEIAHLIGEASVEETQPRVTEVVAAVFIGLLGLISIPVLGASAGAAMIHAPRMDSQS